MIEAVAWALKQRGIRSSEKFVLVALGNFANEELRCYPSIAALEAATSQDRKTVMSNLARLVAAGLIVDTGERVGNTKSIPIYRLILGQKSTENGTASDQQETKQSQISEGEQSRFSVEAVPFLEGSSTKNGTRNRQEPSLNRQGGASGPEDPPTPQPPKQRREARATPSPNPFPGEVPDDVWAGFVEVRKKKRAPLTDLALKLLVAKVRSLEPAAPRALIEQSIERGWASVFPIKTDRSPSGPGSDDDNWRRRYL